MCRLNLVIARDMPTENLSIVTEDRSRNRLGFPIGKPVHGSRPVDSVIAHWQ